MKLELDPDDMEEVNRIIDRPAKPRNPVTRLVPKQPKNKGLYKPRFNGIKHYYEQPEGEES